MASSTCGILMKHLVNLFVCPLHFFSSPFRAFSSTEHHPALHQVFVLLFERLLGSTALNEGPSLDHAHFTSPAMIVSQNLQVSLVCRASLRGCEIVNLCL